MPTHSKSIMLPQNVDSSMLLKHFQPGDTAVVVKLTGVGATGPFAFRDKASRCWTFRWETPLGGHIMRVPLSIWQQDNHRIAHDIALASISNNMRVVVLFMDGPIPAAGPPVLAQLVQDVSSQTKAEDFTVTTSTPSEQVIVTTVAAPNPLPVETGASAPLEAAPALVGPGVVDTATDAPTSEPDSNSITDAIYKAVENPVRIKALCQKLGLDEAKAREVIAASPTKLSLSKQGWVTRID